MKKLLGLLLLAVVAVPAQAQIALEIGPRVGVNVGDEVGDTFVGVDARAGVVALPVDLNGSFDYYLGQENTNFWHLHLGALYALEFPGVPAAPYVGAGLGIQRFSIDYENDILEDVGNSEVGIDLVGGASFDLGVLKPFAQAGISVGGYDVYTLSAGLLFSLGS